MTIGTDHAESVVNRTRLSAMKVAELQELASSLGISGASKRRKGELVDLISAHNDGTAELDVVVEAESAESAEASVADAVESVEAPVFEAEVVETPAPESEAPADAPAETAVVADEAPAEAAPAPAEASGVAAPAEERAEPVRRGRQPRRATSATAAAQHANAGTAGVELVPAAEGEASDDAREAARAAVREELAAATGETGRPPGQAAEGEGEPAAEKGPARSRNRNRGRRGGERSERGDAQKQGGEPEQGEQPADTDRQGGQRQRGDQGRRGDEQLEADRQDDLDSGRPDQGGRGQQGQARGEQQQAEGEGGRRNRYRDRKRRGQGVAGDELEPEILDDDVLIPIAGILDVLDNYAFVRTTGYLPGPSDVYVSLGQVKKYHLRKGDAVVGAIKQPRDGDGNSRQKYNALVKVDSVNGQGAEEAAARVEFQKLTPLYPQERLRMETEPTKLTQRIIDLIAPIGKGQRGLIVSPPKAGKTIVLQQIANAIAINNPEVHLMVVLVDERPEEVTDMQRTVKGEVIASTFDLSLIHI